MGNTIQQIVFSVFCCGFFKWVVGCVFFFYFFLLATVFSCRFFVLPLSWICWVISTRGLGGNSDNKLINFSNIIYYWSNLYSNNQQNADKGENPTLCAHVNRSKAKQWSFICDHEGVTFLLHVWSTQPTMFHLLLFNSLIFRTFSSWLVKKLLISRWDSI